MAPGRQPPALVPTLTDIVAPGVTPADRAACGTSDPPAAAPLDEALVDELVDRVMARLQPLLQERLQAVWAEWVGRRLAEEVPVLVNDLADVVRAEVVRTLGATRSGRAHGPD